MRVTGKEIYSRVHHNYDVDDSDTVEEERLRGMLKPVTSLRRITPRCCATCAYLKPGDGSAECLRPQGPGFDTGDGEHYFRVCNGYKQG